MGVNVVVMGVIFKTGAEPGWCWVFLSSGGGHLTGCRAQPGRPWSSLLHPSFLFLEPGGDKPGPPTFPLWGPGLHPTVA